MQDPSVLAGSPQPFSLRFPPLEERGLRDSGGSPVRRAGAATILPVTIPVGRTLAQQLSGVFTLFGGIVAAAFLVTAVMYGVSSAWLVPAAERSRLAVGAETAADAAMIDQESGLSAYLLTREASFREPYTQGVVQLARANEALTTYADPYADLAGPLLATRLAEERWHNGWATAAFSTRSDTVAPSMSDGKVLFDAYRTEEATLATVLQLRSQGLTLREQRMTAVRVVLEFAVFLAVFLLALRQHRALRDSVVGPIAALLDHIGRVRDGQLEETVKPAGPRELRQLGDGLNAMVRALAAARESGESRDATLRSHSVQLRLILDASREFSESLNLTYVVGAVRASTAAVGDYARVIVWLMDDQANRLVDAEARATREIADVEVQIGHGVAGRAAKSGRITFESPTRQVRFSDSNLGPVCAIAIPLIVGARVVGVLEARHVEPRVATVQAIEVLEMMSMHAATAIESARLHEVTEERSQMDPLTRLFNRRRLEEDLEAECKRSVRYGRPLAFVMLDVDHFKVFNDTHGHPRADIVLQEVAAVIAGCVRATDTAYRYGGEEFCVLLRETSAVDAMTFAERVRQRIEQRFATDGTGVTASFGVSEFEATRPMPRVLVEAADAAMYESKREGRNRVSLGGESRPLATEPPKRAVETLPS
jgi:diguanylate cyclase (GGDEF)-like protein